MSATSWTPSRDMNPQRWVEYGRQIGRAGNGTAWWIGDWLRYGNAKFGEKYRLAARITGYDEQTLMNYVYVAGRVAPPHRRADVSWSHHAEIAKLERDKQSDLLQRVVAEGLSVKRLRLVLRHETPSPARSTLRVDADRADRWVCPSCGRPISRGASTG